MVVFLSMLSADFATKLTGRLLSHWHQHFTTHHQVVSLGAGYNHATAVTEDGKLYMWGMKARRVSLTET